MKNIYKIYLLSILLIGLSACSEFLDVNEDLNNPSTSAPKNLLPAVLGNAATLTFNAGENSVYYSLQLATQLGNDITRDRWDYRTQTRVGIFRHHYYDVAGNAVNIITEAEKNAMDVNYLGVGKIMLAYSFLITTDVLGDMPYSEAFTGKDSPKYDTQEEVYAGIGILLNEGIQHLEAAIDRGAQISEMNSNHDPVYGGNLRAWKSFAHGLKARFLIHQTNVGVDLTEVVKQVDLALENWRTPWFAFSGGDVWTRNPWGPTADKPLLYSMRVNELANAAPTTFFMNFLMSGTDIDPRVPKHFTPNADGDYLAIESGVGRESTPKEDLPLLLDMAMTKDDSPIAYMDESELHFIKAEALFASNKGAAYQSYINGIISDMEKLEVDATEQNAFLNNPAFVAQNETELDLSDIMTQKLIAMYLHPEAWVDIRRHDWSTTVYPGLSRPAGVDKNIFGEDQWIARIPYNMETEYIYNLPEIERLGAKDPTFLATKLWWMKH